MTPSPDPREMYSEIGALIGSIAQAFSVSEADTIAAIDRNEVALELGRDGNGNRFVTVTWNERTMRVYQGAIKRPPAG